VAVAVQALLVLTVLLVVMAEPVEMEHLFITHGCL
jgi:hypothetical protein